MARERRPQDFGIGTLEDTHRKAGRQGRAFIDFPVDRVELHPNYRKNPTELQKIIETINLVKNDKNTTITNIASFGPTAIAYDYLVPAGATFAARRHVLSWSGSELRLQAADAGGALCDEVGLFALARDDSHGADAPVFTVVLRLQNAMAGDLVSTTFSNRIAPRNMRAGSP